MDFENALYSILAVEEILLGNKINNNLFENNNTISINLKERFFSFVIVKVISQPVVHDLCSTIHVGLTASVTSISALLVARTPVFNE
jgi:5'(3')-deoxyribonucleotidase